MNNSSNRYFVKRAVGDTYQDLTTLFDGLAILSLDGFNARGEAVNVYHEQWVNSQVEDFLVTTQDAQQNDVIIRANVDLTLTFIVSRRYANGDIDEETVYDAFVDYVAKNGAFYIKSNYVNKDVKVVCLKEVKPTTQKLHRGDKSYILATVELHTLDAPQTITTIPSNAD